ncbi:DUF1129 family protein [Lacticaseibacillus saniviri]|uniref:DUF1129 family protein n=1 Tax=Lacticaseibacillus saniviri TaxID=931533 RepID=UPI0006CF7D4B|nr:DUF1129 family protein [Lacticaseibacillus saniviri]
MTEEKTTPEEKNAQVSQERPQASVDELMTQLSKKNDDYVFKLRRGLEEHKVPEAKQEAVLAELLPEIITAQNKGSQLINCMALSLKSKCDCIRTKTRQGPTALADHA